VLAAYAAGAAWLLLASSVPGSSAVYTAGHWRIDDAEADYPSPRAYDRTHPHPNEEMGREVARHYSCELVPIDELEQLALGYGSVVRRACVRLTAKCPWRAPTISVTSSSSSVAKNPSWAGRRADRARP
jgi:hypothetical protein